MSWDTLTFPTPARARLGARGRRSERLRWLFARPELIGLLALTAVLNLWNLSINGWANTYYAAAVRSMSTSWHDFLFASLDKTGLMTVDKPPLAFWVQALSVRIFGFHSLSILVPEALMGVVAVGLIYDMTRRMFGRAGGAAAGLAFALTPITVAIARHNNPDELLDPVLRGRPVVRGARARDRTHQVARVVRGVRGPGVRDEDGRRPVRRPGNRPRLDVEPLG